MRASVTFVSSGFRFPGAETTTYLRVSSSLTILNTFSSWVADANELPPNLTTSCGLLTQLSLNYTKDRALLQSKIALLSRESFG